MTDAVEAAEAPDHNTIDPGGLVYGVLAVATVIAAESTRQETFQALLEASAVTLGMYWLAHAYSHHWGSRFQMTVTRWGVSEFMTSMVYESAILAGGLLPVVALMVAWAAGSNLQTGVTATLWCAGAELALLEVGVGVKNRLPPLDLAAQSLVGVLLGLGVLMLRVLLH